ncbi:hypothetical protein M404DRAFT_510689 [Pisolithus tinctorius Marx 270]|uniref:Uncharacterized protein n=1 Tax=Pisolithus tinctorius Marx 270 TaxID=870435 RepID=A0A0C3NCY1_PISTI|nr:hypothetical protein M404DRAFT_510689 [Pisolithus tinctorius Marx 270]
MYQRNLLKTVEDHPIGICPPSSHHVGTHHSKWNSLLANFSVLASTDICYTISVDRLKRASRSLKPIPLQGGVSKTAGGNGGLLGSQNSATRAFTRLWGSGGPQGALVSTLYVRIVQHRANQPSRTLNEI